MEFFTSMINRIDHWRRVNETMRELNSLDDRALDDLGIARGSIREIALQSVGSLEQRTTATVRPAFTVSGLQTG